MIEETIGIVRSERPLHMEKENASKTTENNLTGFQLHPENINRNGRPPKGLAWAEILEEVGNEIDPKTGKPFKELVSRKLWIKAVAGDINAAREIMDRMEGRPTTKTVIAGDVDNPLVIVKDGN